jgi:hypothetical protein
MIDFIGVGSSDYLTMRKYFTLTSLCDFYSINISMFKEDGVWNLNIFKDKLFFKYKSIRQYDCIDKGIKEVRANFKKEI